MRVALARIFLLGFLFALPAFAERCGANTTFRDRVTLGASLQVLMPNSLPSFSDELVSYGATGAIPLGPLSLHVQGSYGARADLNVILFESGLRYVIVTPFLDFFLLGGAHYLRYSAKGTPFSHIGPNAGFGLEMALADNFILNLAAKCYLQDRTLVALGGWFGIPL